MYTILLTLLIISTCSIFLCTIKVFSLKNTACSKYLVLTAACADIYSVGYVLEMTSRSLDAAMVAVKLEYIGLSFIAWFYYRFVMEYCKTKFMPEWLLRLLLVLDAIVALLVLTVPFNTLYYKSYQFVETGIFPHIETVKAIFYWYLWIEQTAILILCTRAFYVYAKIRKKEEDKKLYNALFYESFIPITGLIINILPTFSGYDFGPLMISTMLSGMIVTLSDGRLFDIEDVAFQSLYDNLGNAIIVLDADANYIGANYKAHEIFPALNEQGIGKPLLSLDSNLYSATSDYYFEENRCYYCSSLRKLYNLDRHAGYLISINDITEMRSQLEEMKRLKNEADSANQAKSVFLANISHEIRTPLNAIIGMAELSEDEESTEIVKSNVGQIKSAGKMLLDIVSDVLDFSKAESGKLEISNANYSLLDLLTSAINITNMRIGTKPIDFYVDINPSLPSTLFGDDVHIKQILMNFLSNADKYTDSGSICLVCDSVSVNNKTILKFDIQDTGRGIRPEDQEKLFKPFSQVDMGKNRKITGTGLGLSIAASLIKLMNGSHSLTSTYGEGSTFSFEIPQTVVDATPIFKTDTRCRILIPKAQTFRFNADTANTETSLCTSTEKKDYSSKRVLIVDDNKVNVKVLSAYLKRFEIIADSCFSGPEAIEKSKETAYDIIFMDHMMPEMDGVEAAKIIRSGSDSLNKNAVIIACTANAIKGVDAIFIEAGMNDFIAKPIQMDSISTILQKYCE